MAAFIRARSQEQKQQRMIEIMAAADRLFHTQSYHDITLTTIAEALGWSRGNLYKYVTTKEEIFLELYAEKQAAFVQELQAALSGRTLPDAAFAEVWSGVLARHQDYLKYHGILTTIIETNVSLENLTAFKRRSFADRQPVFGLLESQCPNLSPAAVRELFFTLLYHGCGLYTHTHCAPLTAQAMEAAGLAVPHDEFAPMYAAFMEMCLEGYRKRSDG